MAVVVVLYLRSIAVTVRQSGLVLVILAACLTWRVIHCLKINITIDNESLIQDRCN